MYIEPKKAVTSPSKNNNKEIMNVWFNFLFEKISMYPDVFILPKNYSSYIDIFI